jgi:hypothetical protein
MTDELVQRVAKLLAELEGHTWHSWFAEQYGEDYRKQARAIIPLIVAHERERCARLMESMAMSRKGQELAIINRKGSKSEARDYQSMAIAHSQGAAAIRAGEA